MQYIIPSKVYEVLKWAALIALPAVGVFIQTVGDAWGMDASLCSAVVTTLDALGVLVGALIAVSSATAKAPEGDGNPEA